MKRTTLFILVGMIIIPFVSGAQETYQWVDEKGTVHFTDDFGQVPEKYQDQVKKKKAAPEASSAPSQAPSPTPPMSPPQGRAPAEPSAEKKDILGRGEDWWRDQAIEWKQKLAQAQKDHEAAQTALKAKEKELEDAKFKPKSFQRKLQDEVKVLEQKLNEQKKRMDEAKNMLENVLPRRAKEYRADPNWVRVD